MLPARLRVATVPDDSLDAVREKERTLAALSGAASPVAAWKAVADLWCSLAFGRRRREATPVSSSRVAERRFADAGRCPTTSSTPGWPARACGRSRRRFFHWTLEFPEVFFGDDGAPRPDAGFDAVVGNPPWDMVRGDDDGRAGRAETRRDARQLLRFSRTSGLYRAQGDGHGNLFQLFVERSFRLARDGGRLGLVVPWGLAADCGSSGLRRLLFDRCRVDEVVGFDNSRGIFPIHRSVAVPPLHRVHRRRAPTSFRAGSACATPAPLETEPGATVAITRRLLDRLSPATSRSPTSGRRSISRCSRS